MIPTADSSLQVAQVIQSAVAPVFLLAGVGAFLNVCALRLARIVDRARVVAATVLESRGTRHDEAVREGPVLVSRARSGQAYLIIDPADHALEAGMRQRNLWRSWQTAGADVPRPPSVQQLLVR